MCLKRDGKKPLKYLKWLLEGIVVGFGAILPGISGGTLCVTFGMYRPLIETLSHVQSGLRKYGLMLMTFVLGIAVGFVALSGLAAWTLERNTTLVTCVFIGFILGTFPEMWQDAGAQGRGRRSLLAMGAGFLAMLAILCLLRSSWAVTIAPGIGAYALCGLLWGLSLIVPGLSSSTLLLFFGLYQPMLAGIATLDFSVLIPMGAAMALTVLLLSRVVGEFFSRHYSLASHALLGIVAATTAMLLPLQGQTPRTLLLNGLAILAGGAASYGFTRIGQKLGKK